MRNTGAPIPGVVIQHVEEAAHLRHLRAILVRAPQVRLRELARLDERIEAHLDGLAVAGALGTEFAYRALQRAGTGEVFVATVRAIEDRDEHRLDKLLAVTETLPAARAGLLSAFGWVSAAQLQGLIWPLLEAASPWRREVALTACAMHSVNPGPALARALGDGDPHLRARALRNASDGGRVDLLDACLAHLNDVDDRCAFAAARSALLLGDRAESMTGLESLAAGQRGGRFRCPALLLLLKVVSGKRARSILASIAGDESQLRATVGGISSTGDPHYAPWLITQMENPGVTRAAGEAFTFITGLDLAQPGFERSQTAGAGPLPNDDPSDSSVAMDPDDGLPWPDPSAVREWWHANGDRFVSGARYFLGVEPTPAHCSQVLSTGLQRQRMAAAEHRTLGTPGTPFFNTAAPTWRQQRLLAGVGAQGQAGGSA